MKVTLSSILVASGAQSIRLASAKIGAIIRYIREEYPETRWIEVVEVTNGTDFRLYLFDEMGCVNRIALTFA